MTARWARRELSQWLDVASLAAMHSNLLAAVLLCPALGSPTAERQGSQEPDDANARLEAPPDLDGERFEAGLAGRRDVEHCMRYAVVEHPERYRIALVREDEAKSFPMIVLPLGGPEPGR